MGALFINNMHTQHTGCAGGIAQATTAGITTIKLIHATLLCVKV